MSFPRTFKCNLRAGIVAIAYSQGRNMPWHVTSHVQWDFAHSYTWEHSDPGFCTEWFFLVCCWWRNCLWSVHSGITSSFSLLTYVFTIFTRVFNSKWSLCSARVHCSCFTDRLYCFCCILGSFYNRKPSLEILILCMALRGKRLWWKEFGGSGWNSHRKRRQAQEERKAWSPWTETSDLRLLIRSARVLKSFNPGQWEVLVPEYLNIHISSCPEISQQFISPFLLRAFNWLVLSSTYTTQNKQKIQSKNPVQLLK